MKRRGAAYERRRAPKRRGQAKLRADAVRSGFCGSCLKKPATEGKYKCQGCRDRDADNREKLKDSVPPGTCSKCFKRPSENGRRSCGKCYRTYRKWWLGTKRIQKQLAEADAVAVVARSLALNAKPIIDLPEELGVCHRTVLRWVSKDVGDGLVEKFIPDDYEGGAVWLRLTPAGREAVNRIAERQAA